MQTATPRPTRRTLLAGAVGVAAQPGARSTAGLEALIAAQMTAGQIPGLGVAACRDGRTLYAAGHGFADLAARRPATARTLFHIASITKTVTASAVLQVLAHARLGLDAPVGPHLDFPLAHPGYPERPITFGQLLTHTSGLSDARYYEIDFRQRGRDAVQPLGDFLHQYLAPGGAHYSAAGSFGAAPGAAWDYSNVGYGLLGYAAGRIGGGDLRALSRRSLFDPLGMRDTRWTLRDTPPAQRATPYDIQDGRLVAVEPVGFPDWPAGMIRASAADMARFAGAIANGGAPILSPRDQAQMLEMTHPAGLPAWLTGQGLGWQESPLDGVRRPNHWGGDPGVFTAAYLDVPTRAAAVVLTNTTATDAAKAAVKTIAAGLLAFARGG